MVGYALYSLSHSSGQIVIPVCWFREGKIEMSADSFVRIVTGLPCPKNGELSRDRTFFVNN